MFGLLHEWIKQGDEKLGSIDGTDHTVGGFHHSLKSRSYS